jgi:hypothetical protein
LRATTNSIVEAPIFPRPILESTACLFEPSSMERAGVFRDRVGRVGNLEEIAGATAANPARKSST